VAVAGLIGLLEFYGLAGRTGPRPLVLLGSCLVVLLILASAATKKPDTAAATILAGGLVASFVALLLRADKRDSIISFAWTYAGILYVGWLSHYLVELRRIESGVEWVILALFTTFAVDTCAYFVGKKWGRHRLAPQISPGKTREGAVAGIFGGMAAAWAISSLLALPLNSIQGLLLGLVVSMMAQIGDLTESMFKRAAGVKDSGRLMPGHGGLLDRVDSILLAGVAVYYFVQLL